MITEAMIAIPKPSMTKELPMNAAVINNVIALMTIKNNPNVTIVTGSVNTINTGLINTFITDSKTLAITAAPIPSK